MEGKYSEVVGSNQETNCIACPAGTSSTVGGSSSAADCRVCCSTFCSGDGRRRMEAQVVNVPDRSDEHPAQTGARRQTQELSLEQVRSATVANTLCSMVIAGAEQRTLRAVAPAGGSLLASRRRWKRQSNSPRDD